MSKLEDIEKAVEKLPAPELERFRAWFEQFDAARFDKKVERDAKAGKLDRLAEQALTEHRAGRSRELRGILRALPSGKPIATCPPPSALLPTKITRSSRKTRAIPRCN